MHSSSKGQGGPVWVHAGKGEGITYAGPVYTEIKKKKCTKKETN